MPETGIPLTKNAAGRRVPESVNGRPQTPYQGVGCYRPEARKAAPPIRSCTDYPDDGDKRLPDLTAALEACGVTGVITGKALYSGTLDFKEALAMAHSKE